MAHLETCLGLFSLYGASELNLALTSHVSTPSLNLFVGLIFETESYVYQVGFEKH